MSTDERRQAMLQYVHDSGLVSVETLAARFRVTPQTIRRDINQLCDQGLLRRYHGGAGLPSSVENLAYSTRQVLNLDEKRRIAAMVAAHVPDHASLFINLGTTTEEVARALTGHRGLRVITNNLNVAMLLSANPEIEVIIAGGVVRTRDRGIVGEATIDFIRQFRVDYGIIGISGIETDGSLLDFDYREVRVSEAIIAQSRKIWLVTDHTKFGRNALARQAHLSQVHALFTDREPAEPYRSLLAEAGVEVHVAPA